MVALRWPSTLRPSSVQFEPSSSSTSPGPANDGSEQVVINAAGFWRAVLTFSVRPQVGENPRARILSARAMNAHRTGRANTVLIGPHDAPQAPGALAGDGIGEIDTLFDDGVTFDDGATFCEPVTPAHLALDAPAGATTLTVEMEGGHDPQAGQFLGFGETELYWIVPTTAPEQLDLTTWVLTIWPQLRAAHVSGAVVNFDMPTCEMRAANDQTGALNFSGNTQATQTLELVEAL